jgi:hypothetical protein
MSWLGFTYDLSINSPVVVIRTKVVLYSDPDKESISLIQVQQPENCALTVVRFFSSFWWRLIVGQV